MKQKNGTVEYIFVRKRSRKFEKSRAVFSELLTGHGQFQNKGPQVMQSPLARMRPKLFQLKKKKKDRNNGHDFSRQKYGIPKYFKGDGEK